MLDQEYQYFIDNRDDLVKKHRGKHIVIKNNAVIGVYDTVQEAYLKTKAKHALGTFLIQLCETESNMPAAIFNSRILLPVDGHSV